MLGSTVEVLVGQFCRNVLRAKSTFGGGGSAATCSCNGAWTGVDPLAEDQSASVGADDQRGTGLGKEQDISVVWC